MHSQVETSTIQTFLRPDIYEQFPVFTVEQMSERLEGMSFELATLLRPRNVRLALQLGWGKRYLSYLRQSAAVKQALLSEVLQTCGVAAEVAEAVAYQRHMFARTHCRPMAYMDRSLPVSEQTYLSAPSLVAVMLSMSRGLPERGTVCEIGMGTGLHALCLAKVEPTIFFVGVECNPEALSLCESNVYRAGFASRFSYVQPEETEWAVANAQFVYATAGMTLHQLTRLTRFGREGSVWLVPRQLTREEFESEPKRSWLWRQYGSYEGYTGGGWNQYLALERFRLKGGGARVREAVLYDVRFVRLEG